MKEFMKSRGHSKSQPQHAKAGSDGRKWDEEERGYSELMVITGRVNRESLSRNLAMKSRKWRGRVLGRG